MKKRAVSGELCPELLPCCPVGSLPAGWGCPFPQRQEGPRSPSQPLTSAPWTTLSMVDHPYLASWDFLILFSLEHKVSPVPGIGVCWIFWLPFFFPFKTNAFWIPSYLLKWKVLLSVETVWIPIYVAYHRVIDVKDLVALYGVIMSVSPLKWGWGGVLFPCSTESEWLNRMGTGVLPNRTPSPLLLSYPSPSRDHLYQPRSQIVNFQVLCVQMSKYFI